MTLLSPNWVLSRALLLYHLQQRLVNGYPSTTIREKGGGEGGGQWEKKVWDLTDKKQQWYQQSIMSGESPKSPGVTKTV